MQGPPTIMGCLGGLAHGLCAKLHKPCTIKPWVVQNALHMVLKSCAKPTFFCGYFNFVFYS